MQKVIYLLEIQLIFVLFDKLLIYPHLTRVDKQISWRDNRAPWSLPEFNTFSEWSGQRVRHILPTILYYHTIFFDIYLPFSQVNAVAAVNADGNVSAMLHPVGFMHRQDETVNVQANDVHADYNKSDLIKYNQFR